jgi:hypothetical protein
MICDRCGKNCCILLGNGKKTPFCQDCDLSDEAKAELKRLKDVL